MRWAACCSGVMHRTLAPPDRAASATRYNQLANSFLGVIHLATAKHRLNFSMPSNLVRLKQSKVTHAHYTAVCDDQVVVDDDFKFSRC